VSQETHFHKLAANDNQIKEEQSRHEFSLSSASFPRQVSGNQIGNRMYGTPNTMQRYFPSAKEYSQGFGNTDALGSARSSARQRFSGLDGAMDDLAGLALETHVNEKTTAEQADAVEGDASCFKASSGKGKQVASSPTRSNAGYSKDASSPPKASLSPKKPGEVSPAKAKLEHVTNKLRRPRKDDPRTMSPEDKQKRTEKWRGRFRGMKAKEEKEIEKYVRDNPRRDTGEGARR
jgi:hypothetical protein